MLVYLGFNRMITAYNPDISKEEAQEYLTESCLWIDGLKIEPPYEEGKRVLMYLNEDDTIRYEMEDILEEEKEITNTDILQKLQEQEKRNLDRDEFMLEQQLLLLNIDLNTAR